MLEKMIGVSPPPKGEALDSKLAHGKDFRGTSKSEYKKDFEKALEKKLDKKKEDLENKKEAAREPEDLKTEKKEKKSLGGTKKKVTEEDDDKIVSNLMASVENKVGTPDSKIEKPAEIEVDIPVKSEAKEESAIKAAQVAQFGLVPALTEKSNDSSVETVRSAAVELPKDISAATELAPQALAQAKIIPEAIEMPAKAELPLKPDQLNLTATAASVTAAAAQTNEKVQNQAPNIEAELSEAVGFTPDQQIRQSSSELVQKMKAFDVDKNATANKSSNFEQNVLSRLQNEQAKNMTQVTEKKSSGESQSDMGKEGSKSLKDLKSDVLDANQLHAGVGQSHADFKSHLGAVAAGAETLSAGKLEEHREANIKEIMNQAQYLVTKGGGEVSVKMSPDGLGELHLKVMFQDGKLNIEMQTQNKDVKKLVEDSLSELKSGLAAHRLSLEHVKINSVTATNADNTAQNQSNLNQGGSQQQPREVWRDFQGNMNNQSDRRSSQDGSVNQPQVSLRSPVANAAAAAGALRTYGGTKGATVNRVA